MNTSGTNRSLTRWFSGGWGAGMMIFLFLSLSLSFFTPAPQEPPPIVFDMISREVGVNSSGRSLALYSFESHWSRG
ncbi:hypothetical protein JTE90_023848 [Oedothorax gibbosus]|uniref:Uncharacterized protein n=1 Tax=Oedothorax gibbosus TaxID=931172 RepID=A0AAV6VJR4_9ARAC|nr:hypothetical protein JTE90_023848 [Oedothorax gibbosus]